MANRHKNVNGRVIPVVHRVVNTLPYCGDSDSGYNRGTIESFGGDQTIKK